MKLKWYYIIFILISYRVEAQNYFYSGGDSNSVFLCQEKRVYVSGRNFFGQLGRGVQPAINSPDIVSGINGFGTLTNIKQVSAKQDHNMIALSMSGDSVITWGSNNNGQLGNALYGNGITQNNRFPYRVVGVGGVGFLTGVKLVAMGLRTGYAVLNDGKVVAWGGGNNGALGNGTNGPDMTSPVFVLKGPLDTLKNVVEISAGSDFCIVLLADGSVWGWGRNNLGQLGQNTVIDSHYAIPIRNTTGSGTLRNIVLISSSGSHAMALSATDTLWAWGNNVSGQIGNNSNTNVLLPTPVLSTTGVGRLRNVVSVAADAFFTLALLADSTVVAWGDNTFGNFGNGGTVSSLVPVPVLDETASAPLRQIIQISTGNRMSFFRRANNDLLVCGDNRFGQLGLGDNTSRTSPTLLTLPCVLDPVPVVSNGTISGTTHVCGGVNNGNITLSGYSGTISAWQYSTNNFNTFVNVPASAATFNFSNITQKTAFRAVIMENLVLRYSDSLVVTIDNPSVGGTLGSNQTVCTGVNSGTILLSGNIGSVLNWISSIDSFATAPVVLSNTTTSATYTNLTQTTYYRAIVKNGVCPNDTSSVVKIKVDALSAGGTVGANTTVCFGTNSGTLALSGSVVGLVQQWEYSFDNFSSFINTIANTTFSQNFSNLTATTYYRAVVKNGVCPSTFSSIATITVDQLSVGGTLQNSTTVCAGTNSGTLTLSSPIGTVLDWELSTDNFSTSPTVLANTTLTENYTNLTQTTSYRVRVRNGVCPSVYSSVAIVTVATASTGGTISGSATVCRSANSGILNLSGHSGTVLQWETSTDNFTSIINIISNTSAVDNFVNLTQTTQYRALVQNSVCPSAYSSIATITVDEPSVGGTLSSSATLCAGSNSGTLTVSGYFGSIVRWEFSTDNFSTVINPIANTTPSESYINISANRSYRVEIKNGVCAPTYSSIVLLTVNSNTVGGLVGTATTVCTGANTGTLSLSGYNGTILQWESASDAGFTTPTVINNTTDVQNFLNLTTSTYFRAEVKNGVCPSAYSASVLVTVTPLTVGGTVSSPATVCYGFNSGTLVLSGFTGNILQWEKSLDNFVSNNTIEANTTPLESYTNLINTTYYRALVKNGTCASQYSSVVEITVNPNSVGGLISGSTTVCVSGNSGLMQLSGYLGSVVQWESSTDNFISVVNAIANTTDDLLYNNLTTSTYFRAQIQNSGCATVYSSVAFIQIDATSVGGALSIPPVVCANSNSGNITLSGQVGSVVNWERSTDNFITNITPISNTTDTETYLNLPVTTYYRAYVQNGVCPAVYSNHVAVTANPASVAGTIVGARNVCVEENSGTLALVGSVGNVVQWEFSNDNFQTSSIVPNTTTIYSYTNINQPTSVRALVQYSPCPSVYSTIHDFILNPPTQGGFISGESIVSANLPTPNYILNNYVGTVVRWEYTKDSISGWNSIPTNYPFNSFTSLDSTTLVRVAVKSGFCPERYSEILTINISREVNTAIKIYPTISPNNDQINDEWVIDNITLYPGNKVQIYNRWGDLVYQENGYDNTSKVWRGQSNVRMVVANHELPEGTYFYVINTGQGKSELSGYVVLNR